MSLAENTPRRFDLPAPVKAIVLPVILIGIWQVWSLTLPDNSPAPTPTRVVQSFIALSASGDLFWSTLQSLGRVLAGFAIAMCAGLVLGVMMGSSRFMRENLDPIIESFRPIAPMAILPIAILWFGTGTPAALTIVAYAAFFPLLINTIHGVNRVDQQLIRAAQTMGVSPLRTIWAVTVPAAIPSVLLGSRLAMGVAWTAIIAAELAVGAKSGGGTSGGIGQMMFVFYAYSIDLNGIVVCMIVVGVIALLIDRLFRIAERHLLPWRA